MGKLYFEYKAEDKRQLTCTVSVGSWGLRGLTYFVFIENAYWIDRRRKVQGMKFGSELKKGKGFKKYSVYNALLAVVSICLLSAYSLVSQAESPQEVVGATTVDLVKARDLYDTGAVFIDVRNSRSWNYGHINGAVHLDFNADEFVILYVSDALDRDTPIVFYCDSSLGATGAMAAFFAASWGYKNVYYFRDGYYSWMASDHPVEFNVATVDNEVIAQ